MEDDDEALSKFLSFVLRHDPASIGIVLDAAGWVKVDMLLQACARHQPLLSHRRLLEIVRDSRKKRFALSDDGARIRANQGHSVAVELGHAQAEPPERLFHGTVERFLASIRERGLLAMQRHHVHLSEDTATARAVAQRRGTPIVLSIGAGKMAAAGHSFYRSDNGVWLCSHVPPEFIEFPD